MRIRFSTRQLLLATAAVAAVLGFLVWIERLHQIDPASETVVVDGKPTELPWKRVKWQPNRSTISHPDDGYLPITAEKGADGPLHIRQRLFRLSYANYLGEPTFDATLEVHGDRGRGQKHFPLFAGAYGGGIMDGSVEVRLDFDDSLKVLSMKLTQQIHSKRIAKQATLRFQFDGERFRAVEGPNALAETKD